MMLVISALGAQAAAWAQSPTGTLTQPAAWLPMNRGLDQTRLRLVAIDPSDARRLYAGSDRLIYQSADGGRQWRECFRAPGQAQLRDLAVDPFDSRHLLAATTGGLYASSDGGDRWQRLFRGIGEGRSQCQVVRFHPVQRDRIWLGTAEGLFHSLDRGAHWQVADTSLSHDSVADLAIEPGEGRVYAVTDRGLWTGTQTREAWTRLLPAAPGEASGAELEPERADEEPAEPATPSQFTAVAIDPQHPEQLYLAGTRGLLVSHDFGKNWERATQLGLGTDEIRHLILPAQPALVVYAATPRGVARFHPADGRWEPLYAGLPAQAVYRLTASQSKIFAATEQGLYSLDLTEEFLAEGHWPSTGDILGNFVHEPTIERVREAAIRYAEVEPEKIQRWRRQASMKALLPAFKIGYDRKNDTYISSSITSTATRAFQTEDPSTSWDASVTWDFGDLIWNGDQTSIDVRSKLMVQLRDDIVSDVTRTFFERRRLQVELLTDPPKDPKAQLEKELRLQELTALLDGLTGGWFSRHVEANAPQP